MMVLTLAKAITVDGVVYDKIELDPTLDQIQAFELAVAAGKPQSTAIKEFVAEGGGVPLEVAGAVRMSAFVKVQEAFSGPFAPSTSSSPAGPASPPT